MKHLMICALMILFVANIGHTAETETDCPRMRESTGRVNPKTNLSITSTKKPKEKGSSVQ
jgi:hypothetical protein